MTEWTSGKGSWYSQFNGKYEWKDKADKPGSAALGVPDNQQGIAFYNQETLGKYFDVRAPNGTLLRLQQTDIGPHPTTGRTIDISAVAAEAFGYTPKNFPTDSIWYSTPVDVETWPPPNDEFDESPTTIEQEPSKPRLKKGDQGAPVAELQSLLGLDADGIFGADTEKAVVALQSSKGLEPDGIVGPATWAALTVVEVPELPSEASIDNIEISLVEIKADLVWIKSHLTAMEERLTTIPTKRKPKVVPNG